MMSWGTLFFYTGLLWLIVFVAGDHPHHFSSFFAVCVLIIAWELFCAWRSFCIKPVYHLVLVNAYVGIKKRIYTSYFFIMILYHYFLKVYRIKNTLSNRGVYQKKWTQLSLDACFKIFSHIFHRQTRGDKKTPSPTPIASQALYHHHGRQWPICKRKKQWTAFV